MNKVEDKTELKDNKERNPPLPGSDLAMAAGITLWGVMLNYFPSYAGVSFGWSIPFRVLGYACYVVGFIGSLTGLSTLLRSQFLGYAGIALAFGALAYGLHVWADSLNTSILITFLMRFGVLVLLVLATGFISVGLPHLFVKTPSTEHYEPEGLSDNPISLPPSPRSKTRFEQFASIVVALLSLLTALIPLIKELLK